MGYCAEPDRRVGTPARPGEAGAGHPDALSQRGRRVGARPIARINRQCRMAGAGRGPVKRICGTGCRARTVCSNLPARGRLAPQSGDPPGRRRRGTRCHRTGDASGSAGQIRSSACRPAAWARPGSRTTSAASAPRDAGSRECSTSVRLQRRQLQPTSLQPRHLGRNAGFTPSRSSCLAGSRSRVRAIYISTQRKSRGHCGKESDHHDR